MIKKKLKAVLLGFTASLLIAGTVYAGTWQEDGRGWKYVHNDGSYHYGWLQDGGKWYYLDSSGHCLTNASQTINGRSFVFDENGVMQYNGWVQLNGKWYYTDANGVKLTGWQKIGGHWFFLDPAQDGMMLTGWQKINNTWYFLYDSGNMAYNTWLQQKGKQYYVKEDGAMVTGWHTIGGKPYLFNSSGEWMQDSDTGNVPSQTSQTEEILYNMALEDMTWDEIKALSTKYYTTFGTTPADCIAKLNLARKEAKLSDLKYSTKLTKSAYAMAIAQRAWGFEGKLDYSKTDAPDYETALDLHGAKSLAVGVVAVRGDTLDAAINEAIGTKKGLAVVNNVNATTCGVGFIKSAEKGDYIVVIYTGRTAE